MRIHAAAVLLALVGFSVPARANLCQERHIQQRHRDEAAKLKLETFSPATPSDYRGREDYNARVIACNRSRDSRGKDVEGAIPAGHVFASTLGSRVVIGKIFYMNVFWMRYGYALERQGGTWTLTVAARFHFPSGQTIDLPMELAQELGIQCRVGRDQKHKFIPREKTCDPTKSCCGRKFQACEVGKSEKFAGVPATTHLMRFWQRHIERFWTRPGFTLKFKVINLGDLDAATVQGYDQSKMVWEIRMNDRPASRAMYRASVGKPHPLYTGLEWGTFVHEVGHAIGLDDEYPEDKKEPAWRDCQTLSSPATYIMCHNYCEPSEELAKGVYPWILTRRYAVGSVSEGQCQSQADCPTGTYCDTGTLTVGRNRCVPVKATCEACSDDKQCQSPAICQGKPAGKCIARSSKNLGGSCCKDEQCVSLSCNTDGRCQCKFDLHCSSAQYCAVGFLGVGKNQCVAKKADCDGCSGDAQCASGLCQGKPAGKCIVAASKSIGVSCCKDQQCRSGSCNTDGRCQCKTDADCGSGKYCAVGTLGIGKNECVAKKADCTSCSQDSVCASGFCGGKPLGKCIVVSSKSVGSTCCRNDQCRSGKCQGDKCVCSKDSDCPSGKKCKKPLVGANHCK